MGQHHHVQGYRHHASGVDGPEFYQRYVEPFYVSFFYWSISGFFIPLGIIEKSATDGQKVYHASLERAMRAHIKEHQSEFVPMGIDPSAIELSGCSERCEQV